MPGKFFNIGKKQEPDFFNPGNTTGRSRTQQNNRGNNNNENNGQGLGILDIKPQDHYQQQPVGQPSDVGQGFVAPGFGGQYQQFSGFGAPMQAPQSFGGQYNPYPSTAPSHSNAYPNTAPEQSFNFGSMNDSLPSLQPHQGGSAQVGDMMVAHAGAVQNPQLVSVLDPMFGEHGEVLAVEKDKFGRPCRPSNDAVLIAVALGMVGAAVSYDAVKKVVAKKQKKPTVFTPRAGQEIKLSKLNQTKIDQLARAICTGAEFTMCVDASYSMVDPDVAKNGKTRMEQLAGVASSLAETASQYNTGGLTLKMFGDGKDNVTTTTRNGSRAVNDAFAKKYKNSNTPLPKLVSELKDEIIAKRKAAIDDGKVPARQVVLVFTDGAPVQSGFSSREAMEDDIFNNIAKLAHAVQEQGGRHDDVAISFIQVGDDKHATEFLQRLDDRMKNVAGPDQGKTIDIVDTKTLTWVENHIRDYAAKHKKDLHNGKLSQSDVNTMVNNLVFAHSFYD